MTKSSTISSSSTGLKGDAAFVYGGYLLRYLSLIVLIPYYGRVLGPVSYGRVLAAMSLMNIVWVVVGYGFSPIGARELAMATTLDQRGLIFGRQTFARVILVPIGILVGATGTLRSPVLSENISFGMLATIQGILAAFNLGWFFQGTRRFRMSIMIEALNYPLNIGFVLASVRNSTDGVNAIASLVATSSICLLIAYYLSTRLSGFRMSTIREAVGEIKRSTVMFIASVSSLIMTAGSTYLLSMFSTSKDVGYFGTAERFAALGLSLLGPAGQILMPTISHLRTSDSRRAYVLARSGILLETGYGIVVLLSGVTLSPFLLPLIMGEQFRPSVRILQILACMFPFAAFSHAVRSYVLIPLRQERLLIYSAVASAVVNLVIAIIAGPRWGAMGVAVARLLGEIAAFAILAIAVQKTKAFSRLGIVIAGAP